MPKHKSLCTNFQHHTVWLQSLSFQPTLLLHPVLSSHNKLLGPLKQQYFLAIIFYLSINTVTQTHLNTQIHTKNILFTGEGKVQMAFSEIFIPYPSINYIFFRAAVALKHNHYGSYLSN